MGWKLISGVWVLTMYGLVRMLVWGRAQLVGTGLTPRRWSASSRWRGTTVTSSISQRKAISGGVRPEGRGSAMVVGLAR